MNKINFLDTHVYPGCAAIFYFAVTPNNTAVSAIAEFSDGMVADATVDQVDPEEVSVRIKGYTTARGTTIPEKIWRLKYDKMQDYWKVVERI